MNAEMQLLANERKQTTFCVEEMTNIIDGGEQETQRRREIGLKIVFRNFYINTLSTYLDFIPSNK